ncbi:MAG: tRNA (N(6)-L-threonylcarbamoyladenosine(37)-C(2))-methylthiotransferase MtaB, partial [Bacteroidia bacterium]
DFQQNGYKKVDFKESADVYVINTCSVTENADRECRQIVNSALAQSPDAFIVVTGCYAQLKPEQVAKMRGVDLVLGASEKFNALKYLDNIDKKEIAAIYSCDINEVDSFKGAYSVGDRTRSFLKVQDGCDYSCSFCTIPLARGSSRSDSIENVLKNAQEIAKHGVKEIVLTGVNIGDFGKNNFSTTQKCFFDLAKELDKIEGLERIRISSIEPNLLKDEIIELVASSKHFVPHFHIPLQSGSNEILKKMRRRYLRELYVERVRKIKSLMPHCCIGVDVIVGFPGETDEHFMETYNFLNDLDISYLHVFTYSERDNTDALEIKETVPISVRKQRNKMLRILSAKKQHYFYEQQIGKQFSVLFEAENKNGFMYGFTENYVKIKHPFDAVLINTIKKITLSSIDSDGAVLIDIPEMIPVSIH